MMLTPAQRRSVLGPVRETSKEFAYQPPDQAENPRARPACPNCYFGQRMDNGRMKCRRFPPVVNPTRPGETMFPIMADDDYCGEFQQG